MRKKLSNSYLTRRGKHYDVAVKSAEGSELLSNKSQRRSASRSRNRTKVGQRECPRIGEDRENSKAKAGFSYGDEETLVQHLVASLSENWPAE